MSKIKLVAMDLDNTLLDSNKQISEHTKEVLKEAIRQGVYIVPATGRIFKDYLYESFIRGCDIGVI